MRKRLFEPTVRWLTQTVPPRQRRHLKRLVDTYSDVARQYYYGEWGEDAFLQRYFHKRDEAEWAGIPDHIARSKMRRGFYVDIGAFAPRLHSNSYWFYRHGWRGINVDATPDSMAMFRKVRPRDVNVEVAISNQEGPLTFYWWDTPFSVNTLSAEHAEQWAQYYGQPSRKAVVQAITLEHLLDTYLPVGQAIDFLTVDVEEHDLEVLKSNNWEKYRPEVVVAESYAPSLSELGACNLTNYLGKEGYELRGWLWQSVFYRDKWARNRG